MAKDTLDKKPASTDGGVAHTNGVDNHNGPRLDWRLSKYSRDSGRDMEITRPRRSAARLIVPVVLALAVIAWQRGGSCNRPRRRIRQW